MKQFTKDDLQNGMLVEYRDGDIRMVWNGNLFDSGLRSVAFLSRYNDNITHCDCNNMDIVGIYEHSTTIPLSFTKGNLIWKREEDIPVKKPYTLELTEEQVNKIKQDIEDGVL